MLQSPMEVLQLVNVALEQRHGVEDESVEELELSVRSYNCLKREGVETVGDLINKSEQELMCIPNFGRKSVPSRLRILIL